MNPGNIAGWRVSDESGRVGSLSFIGPNKEIDFMTEARMVLITGATGQDGAYLSKYLLNKGCIEASLLGIVLYPSFLAPKPINNRRRYAHRA